MILHATLALAMLQVPTRAHQREKPVPPIDSMALRAHTYFLSHDLLEGRETGSRGGEVAARYIAAAAERLGLQGAADSGAWFQDVPLVEATIDTGFTTLTLTDSLGTRAFGSPSAFIPNGGTAATL